MRKSACSFICKQPPVQWSCDASPGCSLPQRNGVAVSEMKLKLTMHANSRKKKKKEKYRKYKGCSPTSLCSVRRLSRLTRQGRDASVPVQPRQAHDTELWAGLLSSQSVPASAPGQSIRTKQKAEARTGRVVLVNGCVLMRK